MKSKLLKKSRRDIFVYEIDGCYYVDKGDWGLFISNNKTKAYEEYRECLLKEAVKIYDSYYLVRWFKNKIFKR